MKSIAIVDDIESNRKVFKRFLEDKYSVVTYENGVDFLEQLPYLKTLPDYVILDVMMPKMSGYEVCKLIKASEKYNHIKVFLCTALNSDVDIEKSKEAKADDYIVKPVKYQDLHYFIEHHDSE